MNLKSLVSVSILKGGRRRLVVRTCVGTIVLITLLVCAVSVALADTPNFPDVPASHPYRTAIMDLASRGIIGGYTNGNFGPSDPVTRQQFAKMAVLAGGYPVSEADVCPFSDVSKGDATTFYPDNYVAVCAAKGITTGKTATTFDPYSNITRYQVVTMVARMADNLQPGLLATPPAGFSATGSWGNNATHGANAARAEYNGLLTGLDLSTLDPNGNMSRGEVAQVLYSLLGKLSSGWENLGGNLASGPAVVSSGSNHLDVFARSTDNAVMHKSFDGSVWSNWESFESNPNLGGVLVASRPAAVSWGSGRIDLFVRAMDTHIWHRAWAGSAWSEWEDLGGNDFVSAPAAASLGPNHLIVFVRGADSALWYKSWDGNGWSAWDSFESDHTIGGVHVSDGPEPVAAVAYAASDDTDRIAVYVRAMDNLIWRILWDGSTWSSWAALQGASFNSGPAAVFSSPDRRDLFALGQDNTIWHSANSGGDWSDWASLGGGAVASAPAAVAWGADDVDIFVRGNDNALWYRHWDGSQWSQ